MFHTHKETYRFGDFELQPSARALLRSGEKVALAPKTFEVLLFLLANAGRVVLKEELMKAVWPESFVEESNLTQHIFWLRKALGDKSTYIATLPGRGYQFTASVLTVSALEEHIAEDREAVAFSGAGFDVKMQRSIERSYMVFDETTTIAPAPRRRSLVWPLAAVGSVVLLAAGCLVWSFQHRTVPGDHHEVVVADFRNATGDPDFDHSLNTLLGIDLNQSPYLIVAAQSEITAVLKLMNQPQDGDLTPVLAREVCERLNDQVVLSGLIARFGQKYLVTLTATDCTGGRDLVQAKAVAEDRDGVIQAVDAVAADMRQRLGEPLLRPPRPEEHLQRAHTFSLDALKAFSQAHALADELKYPEAIGLYQHAVELDPRFASAYLGLSDAYYHVAQYGAGEEAITHAYALRDQAGDSDAFSIAYHYDTLVTSDMFAAIRDSEAWAEMYPNQAEPWINLADMQSQVGRPELGVDPGRHAVSLDPSNAVAYQYLARAQLRSGRLDDAQATCQDAIRRHLDGTDIHISLYKISFLRHDPSAMTEQVAWARGKRAEPNMTLQQASVASAEGRERDVANLLQLAAGEYKQQGNGERASQLQAYLTAELVEVGLLPEARKRLAALSAEDHDFPQIMIAFADSGNPAQAQADLDRNKPQSPADTSYTLYEKPWVSAAISLARSQPEGAITVLQPALVFDLHDYALPAMRGRAYLAAKQPAMAQTEFHKILDHPAIDALASDKPLAHLGLARALAMQGNHSAARAEYAAFFTLWQAADADLPLLQHARKEYAALQ